MTNWIKYHSAVATLARHSYLTFTTDKAKFPDSNQPRANGGEDASDSTLKESVRMHTQHRHSHSIQTGLTNTLLEIKQDKAILHRRTPIAVTLGQACSIPIPPSSQPPNPTCRQIHFLSDTVRGRPEITQAHYSILTTLSAFTCIPKCLSSPLLPFNSSLYPSTQDSLTGTNLYFWEHNPTKK